MEKDKKCWLNDKIRLSFPFIQPKHIEKEGGAQAEEEVLFTRGRTIIYQNNFTRTHHNTVFPNPQDFSVLTTANYFLFWMGGGRADSRSGQGNTLPPCGTKSAEVIFFERRVRGWTRANQQRAAGTARASPEPLSRNRGVTD